MKKIALFASMMCLAIAMISLNGHAAEGKKKGYSRNYGMAGCGLGSMVVGKKGGQIFASTTNETAFNQMFGITFGSLNCEDEPNSEVAKRMDYFVAANKVALTRDIARGGGETLASLTVMMGCNGAEMGPEMQKSFRQIFPDASLRPNEITDNIITTIRTNEALASSCKKVI